MTLPQSEDNKVVVTHQQGSVLLNDTTLKYPEKFGDSMKFTHQERATFARNIRQLYKALKKVSPGFQLRPLMKPVFGDPANWKEREKRMIPIGQGQRILAPNESPDPSFDLIDKLAEVVLFLNPMARDAEAMILLYRCHPDSEGCFSPADQEEVVWPLAEAIDIVPWLEEKIGLTQGKTMQVVYGGEKKVGGNGHSPEESVPSASTDRPGDEVLKGISRGR